eukprot:857225-Rhodomonas_salina.11
MPPASWNRSVALAREIMSKSLFSVNSCALELQSTWMEFENSLLLDVRLDGSHRASELDRYKVAQIDHIETVRNKLRKEWYPSVVQTVLDPPPDENLEELVAAKEHLFKAIGVLITRQLRGLVESTCSSLATFFESFSSIEEEEISQATAGKNEVKIMPAFHVKLVVSGNHIRIVPGLEELDSSLSNMLDHVVQASDGFPPPDPSLLPSYSPFSDKETASPDEETITIKQLRDDAESITSQLFENVDGSGIWLKVARVEEDSIVATKERIRAVLQANMAGPKRIVEHYEKFVHEHYNLLSLDPFKLGEEYKAAKHSLDDYQADIEKFRKAADDVLDVTVNDLYMGLFVVQTEPVKRGIAAKAMQMAEILSAQVLADNMEEMNETCMRYEQVGSTLFRCSCHALQYTAIH